MGEERGTATAMVLCLVELECVELEFLGAGWERTWLYPGVSGSAGSWGAKHQHIAPASRMLSSLA
jgi:hypothetical protein